MVNIIRGLGQQVRAFLGFGKTEAKQGKQGTTQVSTELGPTQAAAEKTEWARKNPTVLKKTPSTEPLKPHEPTERSAHADQKLKGTSKNFFQRMFSKMKFNSLMKKNQYDEAATLLLSINRNIASDLAVQGKNPDLGKAIAKKANDPETKQAALDLTKAIIKKEIEMHKGDPQTLLRDNTSASALIREMYALFLPPTSQQLIPDFCNTLPDVKNFDTFLQDLINKSEVEKKEISSSLIWEHTQKGLETGLKISESVPQEIREMNQELYKAVKEKYDDKTAKQQVFANFFLRYATPALVTGSKNAIQRRNALMVGKVLQNFSNDVEFEKEQKMVPMNALLEKNKDLRPIFVQNLLGKDFLDKEST